MLLALDIGNTQVTIGLYEKKKLRFCSGIATNSSYTCDQCAIELKNIIDLYNHSPKDITGAIISSVVPVAGMNMKLAIKKLFNISPMLVGPGIKSGLNIKIDNPAQLGSDLVVGAVAAVARYPLPAIIFDFGTATKISVLDKDGSFLGCAITAGIGISIDALSERTVTLPRITVDTPKNVIGTNTVESMRAGIIFGGAALIDGMSERIEKELGMTATLVLTGGSAGLIYGHSKRKVVFCGDLLLEGLRIVYEKNQAR